VSFRKHCYGQTMEIQSLGCTMVSWLLPSLFPAALFTRSTERCSAWKLGPLASNCLVCFHRNEIKKICEEWCNMLHTCITSGQYGVIQFRLQLHKRTPAPSVSGLDTTLPRPADHLFFFEQQTHPRIFHIKQKTDWFTSWNRKTVNWWPCRFASI